MPRWSAERRAPSVIGRGTPLAMASRRAAVRHALRCGDPHRAPVGALPPRVVRGTRYRRRSPCAARPTAAKPQPAKRAAQRWLLHLVMDRLRAGCANGAPPRQRSESARRGRWGNVVRLFPNFAALHPGYEGLHPACEDPLVGRSPSQMKMDMRGPSPCEGLNFASAARCRRARKGRCVPRPHSFAVRPACDPGRTLPEDGRASRPTTRGRDLAGSAAGLICPGQGGRGVIQSRHLSSTISLCVMEEFEWRMRSKA
jgi:hypothetical protein